MTSYRVYFSGNAASIFYFYRQYFFFSIKTVEATRMQTFWCLLATNVVSTKEKENVRLYLSKLSIDSRTQLETCNYITVKDSRNGRGSFARNATMYRQSLNLKGKSAWQNTTCTKHRNSIPPRSLPETALRRAIFVKGYSPSRSFNYPKPRIYYISLRLPLRIQYTIITPSLSSFFSHTHIVTRPTSPIFNDNGIECNT